MRVLVWLTEAGWEACVDAARGLGATDVTLICGAFEDAVETERGALAGLLGRHRRPEVEERFERMSEQAARDLLATAGERLGGDARRVVAGGRVEHAVIRAAREADLLIAARSSAHMGPKSIRHPARFVVDHAPCPLLLVWPPGGPQGQLPPPPPPHHAPPRPH